MGLLAAVLWGLHDFTIRSIAAGADAAALYLMVLLFGGVLLLPFAALSPGWGAISAGVLGFCVITGLIYALGVYALYRAFIIGPVRLVAPICGAFPLLSVGFAVARGQEAGAVVWLASLAVLAGIAIVAQGESGATQGSRRGAITWAVIAALGFAVSFEMLHQAAEQAADLPVTLIARVAGFAGVSVWVIWQRIDLKPAFAIWPSLLLMGALDVGGMLAVTIAGGFARPEFASVASSCFGLVTILLAWRFLHEPLTRLQAFGAVVVFGGIAVLGLV
ncbi:MAG: hypothetical protein CFE33_09880 [Pseudorhodobacter sp. PARRP1]|nr:MAG: hypothetical protein CFE33_09880 [Pseudorhodobacter sp. PARRP1]